MPSADLADAVETFSAPIEHLIVALGQGLAEAQRALDLSSLQTQEALDTDPQTAQLGLQATWYQFPRVDLELKLAVSMVQSAAASPAGASARVDPRLLRASTRLVAQPVSASYQSQFSYDAQAASTLSLSIVPVPPPRAGDASTLPPRLTREDVVAIALASKAVDAGGKPIKFATVTNAQNGLQPDPALRFDVTFNGAVRIWYVLQYPATQAGATPAVIAIDDATGDARVVSTPS